MKKIRITFGSTIKKFFVLLLALIFVQGVLVACSSSTEGKIIMDNIIEVYYSGKDGSGVPHGDIDTYYLDDISNELELDVNTKQYLWRYLNSINIEFEPNKNLSNGDKLTVHLKDDPELRRKAKVSVDKLDYNIVVAGLSPAEEVDPFAYVQPEFIGENGNGIAEAPYDNFFTYEVSPNENLANGDEVTLVLKTDEETLLQQGMKATRTEAVYVVRGLFEIKDYNPFAALEIIFDGYDGYGTVEINNLNEKGVERFAVDKQIDLSNGDKITIKLLNEVEDLQELGFNPTKLEASYQVDGLKPMQELDPFDHFKLYFDGYSGDATASWTSDLSQDIKFDLSKSTNLANGDEVMVSLVNSPQYFLERGYELTSTEATYKVKDLAEYTIINGNDLLDELTPEYYSYSPYIVVYMNISDRGYIADFLDIDYSQSYYSNGDSFKVSVKARDAEKLKEAGYKLAKQVDKLEFKIAEDERPTLINSLDQLDEVSREIFDQEAQAIFRFTWNEESFSYYLDQDKEHYEKYDVTLKSGAVLEQVSILTIKSKSQLDLQDVINEEYALNHVLLQYRLDGTVQGKASDDLHTVVCLSNVCKNPDGSFSYDNGNSFTVYHPDSWGPYWYPLYSNDVIEDVVSAKFGKDYKVVNTISAEEFWQEN